MFRQLAAPGLLLLAALCIAQTPVDAELRAAFEADQAARGPDGLQRWIVTS